jgi:glycosyltransferase involved in cell wall biosynthesis
LRILYICDEYPPGKTGGIGSTTNIMASKLSSEGHKIFVVGIYPHGYGGLDYEEQDSVKIWRLRYKTDIGIVSGMDTLWDKMAINALRMSGVLRIDALQQIRQLVSLIRKLIRDQEIDVIEMPDWNNFLFNIKPGDLYIPQFEVPLIVKMHGSLTSIRKGQGLSYSKRYMKKEKYLYQRADAICSVSTYTAEYCRKLYGIEKEITTMHNGVELHDYVGLDKRANKNKVIFSGSLVRNKGIFSLVKAWSIVRKQIPNATLHIFGKGNIKKVQGEIGEEDLETVIFYGHVARQRLLQELRNCDLAVFPSYTEAFGLAVVEAMSTGCPVIYTSRASGSEVIEQGIEGLLVDPDKTEQISESILLILRDRAFRETLSRAGYKKIKDFFDIDIIYKNQLRYYQRIKENYETGSSEA